ncbi:MAG: 2-isopropylmalate synthase [Treponema sp.]|jgi:2-isopropylmalate synthase|nr:2-isopropylmalate synthase [Treponema sp.]
MRRIKVLDTTLRDGDQAAGFAFSAEAKYTLARALAVAGVDIIETGFPLSNSADFEVCRNLAREISEFPVSGGKNGDTVSRPLTAVMCRGRAEDIRQSAEVFAGGVPGILHISLPVSRIHITEKLGKTETELIDMAAEAVSFARGFVPLVELGAEDSGRAGRNFLREYCEAGAGAGAAVINISDTLGILAPEELAALVCFLRETVPAFTAGSSTGSPADSPGARLSVHCHNDLGLACANTLAAVEAGCGQIEVSVLGIGERAGNAALEEVAANLDARPGMYRAVTGLFPEKIAALVPLVMKASGTGVSPMKPLSGWNVRAHGSGIHQQGLSRNAGVYSPPVLERWAMTPERIVLSRHSGQAGVRIFARRYCGIDLDDGALAAVTGEIKAAPGTATGITELLRILLKLGKLPAGFPQPLVCVFFAETQERTADKIEFTIRASVSAGESPAAETLNVSGEGADEPAAVLEALKTTARLCGKDNSENADFAIRRTEISAYGKRIRLYAEPGINGKFYGIERTGISAGYLLFACGLDAINANYAELFMRGCPAHIT